MGARVLSSGLVAIPTILILDKSTRLIAILPAEISTLLKASVSVVIEMVIEARRDSVAPVESLSESVVFHAIAVNPDVVRGRAWLDVRKRLLIVAAAVSSHAYAD